MLTEQRLALVEAVKCNSASLVQSLIEADANPQLKDGDGESAVDCAARLNLDDICKLLRLDGCKKQTQAFHEGLNLIQELVLVGYVGFIWPFKGEKRGKAAGALGYPALRSDPPLGISPAGGGLHHPNLSGGRGARE